MKLNATKVFTIEPIEPMANFDAAVVDFPVRKRQCKDTVFLILFIAFLTFLSYVVIDVILVKHSNINYVIHGYDNYGNICGQPNKALPNVTNSGLNKTDFPYLFIESITNFSVITRCVSHCPNNSFLLIWNYYKSQLILSYDEKQRAFQQHLVDQWFIAGIGVSLLTIIFLFIVTAMRKRIKLVAILFREAGKAISDMPFLLMQPIWTFMILCFVSFIWIYGLVYLHSMRFPYIDPITGFVSYKIENFYRYMKWYHMFAYLWSVHFILCCQHFVISGSVSQWFFSRSRLDLGSPILNTISTLIRYHLGSIAFGSLLVASVKIVRLIFNKLNSLLNRYKTSCDTSLKWCQCCLWLFEKFVIYVNRNAFIEIAIYGTCFTTSARKAFGLLSNNALKVLALNSVGDFLLFVAKICVVTVIVLIGIELIEDKTQSLHYYWSPIIASAFFAYFVSHCFLSVYEMAIDTLFLCFIEDTERNDGKTKPYFMSNTLMKFIDTNYKTIAFDK
ncbi:choline transporter-like protein 1 [Oppia nitens]|uniref:choline transporter-like protein 1 n=1 Tax=Oppia nitens TaxID=1686743 RepID=UPI0023DBEB9C|nr:choline transporter-like protein 1 [Oppia nitens]